MQELIAKYVGRSASYSVKPGFRIFARIVDVRSRYGNIDLNITPVSGSGSVWVQEDSVVLCELVGAN